MTLLLFNNDPSSINTACRSSKSSNLLASTFVCLFLLLKVDQKEAGTLRTEGQQDALQHSRGHGEGQQQGPQLVRTQQNLQTKDLKGKDTPAELIWFYAVKLNATQFTWFTDEYFLERLFIYVTKLLNYLPKVITDLFFKYI